MLMFLLRLFDIQGHYRLGWTIIFIINRNLTDWQSIRVLIVDNIYNVVPEDVDRETSLRFQAKHSGLDHQVLTRCLMGGLNVAVFLGWVHLTHVTILADRIIFPEYNERLTANGSIFRERNFKNSSLPYVDSVLFKGCRPLRSVKLVVHYITSIFRNYCYLSEGWKFHPTQYTTINFSFTSYSRTLQSHRRRRSRLQYDMWNVNINHGKWTTIS